MHGRILSILMSVAMFAFVVPVAMAVDSPPPPTGAENEAVPSASDEPPPGKRSGEYIYKVFCDGCHGTGAAGAPAPGDMAAWAPRLAGGVSGLLTSVVNGLNAMPPRGGMDDATDEELRRATVFMANKSGAKFKEGRGLLRSAPQSAR